MQRMNPNVNCGLWLIKKKSGGICGLKTLLRKQTSHILEENIHNKYICQSLLSRIYEELPQLNNKTMQLKNGQGFPGGAVVGSLPANAGDTGSSPGPGRSHMPQSNQAPEPRLLSLRVWSLCSATREAATVRGPRTAMRSGPRLPQLEKALAQKRRPSTAKNK